jgi:hypothetical protein
MITGNLHNPRMITNLKACKKCELSKNRLITKKNHLDMKNVPLTSFSLFFWLAKKNKEFVIIIVVIQFKVSMTFQLF